MLANTILVGEEFEQKDEIEQYLKDIYNKKITIKIPKRGEKAKLIELAKKNAESILVQNRKKEEIEKSIQKLFDLSITPYRIEVFDNSHLGGDASVGSMVVWEDGFQKNSYRRYNLEAKDEYAQMRELLQKRAKSFDKRILPLIYG